MELNKLNAEDCKLFFKLQYAILAFTCAKLKILPIATPKELKNSPVSFAEFARIRDALYKNLDVFDQFVSSNPMNFARDELDVLHSWKEHHIIDTFYITKYMKEHTVFYGSGKAYCVLSLTETFEEKFGNCLPIMLKTTLLPFKGKIISDGLYEKSNIRFGKNVTTSINIDCEEAARKFGVITSLDAELKPKELSDEENLLFFMKSQDNRDRYWQEIDALKGRTPKLEAIFHQEQGKINSRRIKQKLKEIGANGFFSVIDDIVVASAESKEKLDEVISRLLPKERLEWVHSFKI